MRGSCGRTRSSWRGSKGGFASSASTPACAAWLRRLAPRALSDGVGAGRFLDWASVEPFTGHVPTVRLRVPHPKLARLHPAELADLVEAASHREGEEIIQAVGADPELEADVFEELESHHQLEFLEDRADEEVAQVLMRMEADDAADLRRRAAGGAARRRSSSFSRTCSGGVCARCWATTRPPPAG